MNYYQTPEYLARSAEQNINHKPNTLLPHLAYNDYEAETLSVFDKCLNDKHVLNDILLSTLEQAHSSTDEDFTDSDTESSSSDQSEPHIFIPSAIEQEAQASFEALNSIASQTGPSIEPLPSMEDSQPAPEQPNTTLHLLMTHLESVANAREDIDEFLDHIKSRYDIDLTEPFDDLPFPVIDEILAYIDYDPDKSEEEEEDFFDFNMFQLPHVIIPREHITEFQNHFNSFVFNIKTLQHLDEMNGITNDRTDDAYYAFQNLFKPALYPLLKLYKHVIHRFGHVLSASMDYYITQDSFDFEYSDHDW